MAEHQHPAQQPPQIIQKRGIIVRIYELIVNEIENIGFCFRDISNYFYIIRTIRKIENSPKWKSFNLRHDWFYNLYTVISLEESAFQGPEEQQLWFFREQLVPICDFLREQNLGEILKPFSERVKVYDKELKENVDSLSFLVIFKPIRMRLDFSYLFSRSLIIACSYYLYKFLKPVFIAIGKSDGFKILQHYIFR